MVWPWSVEMEKRDQRTSRADDIQRIPMRRGGRNSWVDAFVDAKSSQLEQAGVVARAEVELTAYMREEKADYHEPKTPFSLERLACYGRSLGRSNSKEVFQ
jgi:hypothetical protein